MQCVPYVLPPLRTARSQKTSDADTCSTNTVSMLGAITEPPMSAAPSVEKHIKRSTCSATHQTS